MAPFRKFLTTNISSRSDLFCCVLFILIITMSLFLSARNKEFAFLPDPDTTLSAIKNCHDDASYSCTRPLLAELLRKRSGSDVMTLLSLKFAAGKCHLIGHIVGQEEYSKFNNVEKAIADCSTSCAEACIHGITGKAFLEATGLLTGNLNLEHLSGDELRTAGKRLCNKIDTCHGVGHALFQAYNEFKTPISICSSIATGTIRQSCFTGVFMEHADANSSHNILLGSNKKQLRNSADLLYPCDSVSDSAQHACYRYQPRVETQVFKDENIGDEETASLERKACESIDDLKHRSDCFEGLGFAKFTLIWINPVSALSFCSDFQLETDRAGCLLGMVFYATDEGHMSDALAFCSSVLGQFEKDTCYHAIFDEAHLKNSSYQELQALCSENPSHVAACSHGLSEYLKDPWTELYGLKLPKRS